METKSWKQPAAVSAPSLTPQKHFFLPRKSIQVSKLRALICGCGYNVEIRQLPLCRRNALCIALCIQGNMEKASPADTAQHDDKQEKQGDRQRNQPQVHVCNSQNNKSVKRSLSLSSPSRKRLRPCNDQHDMNTRPVRRMFLTVVFVPSYVKLCQQYNS